MARTKPLVMVIDGNVDGLKTAARATSNVLTELENGATATREAYVEEFDRIANVSQAAMDRMAKGITADINRMRREAEQASRLGTDFNPAAGFNSQSQQLFADNSRKAAALAFEQEAAYRAAAAAGGELGTRMEQAANSLLLHAKSLTLDADAAELVADELRKVETATSGLEVEGEKAVGTSGAMRTGFQQAGFQISDFAVQVGGGTSAIRAGAQQAPQLIQALALMGGGADQASTRFGRFAAFMGGPYGAAITVAVSILGALATSLLDTEDAADEAEDRTYDFGRSLDFLSLKAESAQDAIKQLVGETERLLKIEGDFSKQVAANAQRALVQGQQRVANAQGALDRAEAADPAAAALGLDIGPIGEARAELEAAKKFVAEARIAAQNAQIGLSQRSVIEGRDPFKARLNRIAEQVGTLEQRRRDSIDVEALDPSLRNYELRKRNAIYISEPEYRAELARLEGLREAAEKAKRDSERTDRPSRGGSSALGGTVALLKELFPGVQITSTTGGKHTKGSDHYAGRAVDFVIPGQMSEADFEGVRSTLEQAGVQIRRGSSGREQFFGPGNGARTKNDHNDHYHLAFEGTPSPEDARKVEEKRDEEAQRNRQALEGALLASKEDQARLARLGVTDAARLAELDIAAIDAALERKLAQNAKLALDHSELDALDRANAETEKRAVAEKLRTDLAEKALTEERRRIGAAAQLIEIEGQMATSTREKKAAAQKLLNLRYRDDKLAASEQLARDGNVEAYLDNLGLAQANKKADQNQLDKTFQSDTGRYFDKLKANVGDMDEAFDGVAARGLASLEDGLVGLIDGTENVAGAFKRMATSILADLARIAIQKAILSAFGIGFAQGNVPAKATGHIPGFASGVISGPGSGTSDSIFAWHEGMGLIRVSNGESIITAKGTRKHRGLLKAINEDTLPAFAAGMIGEVSYPTIPSAASLREGRAAPVHYFDLRGSVVLEELFQQMHQISAAHAGRALAAAPAIAMDEMAQTNSQRIPT
ncbi:hypothetical protein [Qipengyuania sp.]|uniref:hypothetical protein n=1 Tax=Qipengyuania sp. TaxID=2004515 RepID=UPI0035C7FB4E